MGLIVPIGDANALAQAMLQTMTDGPGTAPRVAAARQRVENELSFERRVRTLESIYEDMVCDKSCASR